jgi:hypothetical protein
MIVVGQMYVWAVYSFNPSFLSTWQFSHGGAVFIYLFLNRSMRREIVKTFFSGGICGSKTTTTSVTTVTKLNNSKPAFTSQSKGEDDESTRY